MARSIALVSCGVFICRMAASYARIKQTGPGVSSQLPALLSAISADQQRVSVGPTVAGAPLVVLCWFVIFLAVAQTAQALGKEFGFAVDVLERADMEKLGMGSALSVGRASYSPCKFIVMHYQGGPGTAKPIVP